MSKKPSVRGMSRKQRAATMIAIREQHAGRSPRAISMDARQTARRSLDPDTDDLFPWQKSPNRYDVQGVDDMRVVAKIPKLKVEPEPKITKKDALGREIVYEVVSKYGKGIGWWHVVRLPDGGYGIHRISREGSREVDAYGGMEKSLTHLELQSILYLNVKSSLYSF